MRTETKYEEIILNEIRTLPMPVLPQVIKILRILKEGALRTKQPPAVSTQSTGFCGTWQDERSAEEIIKGIAFHRTGFGSRRVDL